MERLKMKNTFVGFYPINDLLFFDEKDSIILAGVPIEKIKSTRGGSKKAPNGIRKQSLEFSGISSEFDITKSQRNCFDIGNINPTKEKEKLDLLWKKITENNNIFLALGGDHSITYEMLKSAPWNRKTAIIWIDAHADLNDEYPPNIFYSHGTVFSNLKKDMKLKKEQMLFIGGHAYTQTSQEYEKLKKQEVNFIPTYRLFTEIQKIKNEISDFIKPFDQIYLSIDLDCLDQAFVPTLATAEPFGLTPHILNDLLKIILPKTKYVDVVEARFTKKDRSVLNLVVALIYFLIERLE